MRMQTLPPKCTIKLLLPSINHPHSSASIRLSYMFYPHSSRLRAIMYLLSNVLLKRQTRRMKTSVSSDIVLLNLFQIGVV